MKNIFLFVLLLLFAGCDGKIYRNIYDKSQIKTQIVSVEIIASDAFSKESVSSIMQKRGFLIDTSEYKLRVENRNYKKACTNPLSKTSSDYSFDGLLAIELFKKDIKIYTAYMDYKGEAKEALFEKLIDAMIEDLEIQR